MKTSYLIVISLTIGLITGYLGSYTLQNSKIKTLNKTLNQKTSKLITLQQSTTSLKEKNNELEKLLIQNKNESTCQINKLENQIKTITTNYEKYKLTTPTPQKLTLNPKKTALLIVDMQNRYCYPNASLYAPEADEAMLNIKKLTEKAREYEMPIIYTWMNTSNIPWENKIVEALKPESQDYIIEKSHYSMLLGHSRDSAAQTISEFGAEYPETTTFIIVGAVTNVCVFFNADTVFSLGYNIVLPVDCLVGDDYYRSKIGDIGYDYTIWFLCWFEGARITDTQKLSFE